MTASGRVPLTVKKIGPWVITFGILGVIFARIDLAAFLLNVRAVRWWPLVVGIALFIPIVAGSVARWRSMFAGHAILPFGLGVRCFLAATSLNSVVPSKLGDLGKAWFIHRKQVTDLPRATNSVILEKLLDLSGLCVVFVASTAVWGRWDSLTVPITGFAAAVFCGAAAYLLVHRPWNPMRGVLTRVASRWEPAMAISEDAPAFTEHLGRHPARLGGILLSSVGLWILHMVQIYFFFLALNADVTFGQVAALAPVAILVGLLPITVGGMGTRDAALIALFLPWVEPSIMAGVGLLVSARYWIPALFGVFFLPGLLHGTADGPGITPLQQGVTPRPETTRQ
jgi:glycosyltransferase 2 family protein